MVTSKMAPQARSNHRIYASNSSTYGFRLVDSDHTMDTLSSQGRNSIYKMKIDSMFDDSRSIISQRYDEGMRHRRRPSSNYGSGSMRSTRSSNNSISNGHSNSNNSRISNSVQAQIERMFSDVENETVSCSFSVRCLGALPLKDKVTSLSGLQDPLRQLYLSGAGHGNQNSGTLEICPSGLRMKMANGRNSSITPYSSIAVWSAVKFVVSQSEGGAAFLPLITDPENIDKSSLFRPLNAADKRRLSSGLHSPLFAVVMRSTENHRQLECHAYVCQTPETAIVLAATLYQCLMAHMSNSQHNSKKKVKTHNGISRMSVASSQATTNLVQSVRPAQSIVRSESQKSSSKYGSVQGGRRKRRPTNSSVEQGGRDIIRSALIEVSSEERSKKKSSKSRRAPPIPTEPPPVLCDSISAYNASMSYLEKDRKMRIKNTPDSDKSSKDKSPALSEKPLPAATDNAGDILTKVAIPRSGSFLNTGGLTRYKSKNNRRNLKGSPTHLGGGGGGSPLGFSELFQEFRLQENLHSLDEILNAIINTDGMSYNNLKPIYKEFLLKLAVTLTKDELYQRSKSIMRRQKKKKVKKQKQQTMKKQSFVSVIGLKQVFKFGHFRNKTANKTASKTNQQTTKGKGKKAHHFRSVTSGSEVSVVGRHEHTLGGQHRNSSSGYVSCSECSYDSDSCTCASADRCYCSMGGDSHNELHAKLSKCKTNSGRDVTRRDSLPSCNSEDKCYCSMPESSAASTCTSDSCASVDKCYCAVVRKSTSSNSNSNKKSSKCANNLSLDYELFTTGDNTRHVKPVEALSVKKSVEAAAMFADLKLSQTTDITNLRGGNKERNKKKSDYKIEEKKNKKKHDKQHEKEIEMNSSVKSSSSEVELRKTQIQKNALQITKSNGYYQTIPPRPLSTSLEDSLGYLP